MTRQATQLVVGGEPRALRKMTANGRLVLLLVDERGPKVRAISCAGGLAEEASCQRLFTTVWPWEFALGPPGSIPRKIERLIAGRQVSVPAGCTITPGHGSISCSDLSVMARVAFPDVGWLAWVSRASKVTLTGVAFTL